MPEKRHVAIKQVEATFEKIKSMNVGMVKPGTDGRVTAKKVHAFIPHFQALPLKVMQVVNDDVGALEENIPLKKDA